MKNAISGGAIVVFILSILSLFATVPNLVTSAVSPGAALAQTGTPTATASAAQASAPSPAVPVATGVTTAIDDDQIAEDSFAECVQQQFGLQYQQLSVATQAEIVKNFERFATQPCIRNVSAPTSSIRAYWGWLVGGFLTMTLLFVFIPSLRSIIAEPDSSRGRAYKLSLSRYIALIGMYVIIVTFAFTAEYAFWALTVRGDNSIFEQTVRTILVAGFAAFTPYIANQIAGAVSGAKSSPPPAAED